MAIDHIVFEHKHTGVPNRILSCRRLSTYQILLDVMLNLVNMRKNRPYHVPNPNELTIPKKELRSVLGFCGESIIEKQLTELRNFGIVTSFSKQGGEDGHFFVTLAENYENNPYVLMDMAEKQVIKDCNLSKKNGGKNNLSKLFGLIKQNAKSVEADYIAKLTQEVGALDEYKAYLKSVIVESGLGTFNEEQQKTSNVASGKMSKVHGENVATASIAKQKYKPMQEAKQEYKGMDSDDFMKLMAERGRRKR